MFEVYANQECTERPVTGQSYETLYVKVNGNAQGRNYTYGESQHGIVVTDNGQSGSDIELFVDWTAYNATLTENAVIAVSAPDEMEVIDTVFSFGPVAPFIHEFEVYSSGDLTERPIVGGTYQELLMACKINPSSTLGFNMSSENKFERLHVGVDSDGIMINLWPNPATTGQQTFNTTYPLQNIIGTIELTAGDSITIESPLQVSFGAVVDPDD